MTFLKKLLAFLTTAGVAYVGSKYGPTAAIAASTAAGAVTVFVANHFHAQPPPVKP